MQSIPGCTQLRTIWSCPVLRVCRAQSLGPGAPVGVLLAGGADGRTDVEVGGPSRETYLLPWPQPEQVPPPKSHTSTSQAWLKGRFAVIIVYVRLNVNWTLHNNNFLILLLIFFFFKFCVFIHVDVFNLQSFLIRERETDLCEYADYSCAHFWLQREIPAGAQLLQELEQSFLSALT